MKNKKACHTLMQISSILLILILLVIPSYADTSRSTLTNPVMEVELEQVTARVGNEVSIDLRASYLQDITGMTLVIEYDTEVLAFIPRKVYHSRQDCQFEVMEDEGKVYFSVIADKPLTYDHSIHLATFTFEVLQAQEEETPLRISSAKVTSEPATVSPIKLNHGSIYIHQEVQASHQVAQATIDTAYIKRHTNNKTIYIALEDTADQYEIILTQQALHDISNQSLVIATPYAKVTLKPDYIQRLKDISSQDITIIIKSTWQEGIGTKEIVLEVKQGTGELLAEVKQAIEIELPYNITESMMQNTLVPYQYTQTGGKESIIHSRAEDNYMLFTVDSTGHYGIDNQIVYFEDISSSWAKHYIEYLAARGVIQGRDAQTFDPHSPVTAKELALMLTRIYDEPLTLPQSNQPLTREEVSAILIDVASQLDKTLTPIWPKTLFNDDDQISPEQKEGIYMLQTAGILQGDEKGNMNPKQHVTRAEISKILVLYIQSLQ